MSPDKKGVSWVDMWGKVGCVGVSWVLREIDGVKSGVSRELSI